MQNENFRNDVYKSVVCLWVFLNTVTVELFEESTTSLSCKSFLIALIWLVDRSAFDFDQPEAALSFGGIMCKLKFTKL